MAKRYSGSLQISVTYDDKNYYRASVSEGGKVLWRGRINPAPAGFGSGIGYDSPVAYDEVAKSAISFANDDEPSIADSAEYNDSMSGFAVKRSSGAAKSSRKRTGSSKTATELDREIDAALRDG